MPKPVSDLERYLAGELGETAEILPAVILFVAIVLVVVAAL